MLQKIAKPVFVVLMIISINFILVGFSMTLCNINSIDSKSIIAMYEPAINTVHRA